MTNSFATKDGGHVTGAVAMALGEDGVAVPIDGDTPIGMVKIEGFTFAQFCRALGAHAALVTGNSDQAEDFAQSIIAFARKDAA